MLHSPRDRQWLEQGLATRVVVCLKQKRRSRLGSSPPDHKLLGSKCGGTPGPLRETTKWGVQIFNESSRGSNVPANLLLVPRAEETQEAGTDPIRKSHMPKKGDPIRP
jgi:hypothetical protein